MFLRFDFQNMCQSNFFCKIYLKYENLRLSAKRFRLREDAQYVTNEHWLGTFRCVNGIPMAMPQKPHQDASTLRVVSISHCNKNFLKFQHFQSVFL